MPTRPAHTKTPYLLREYDGFAQVRRHQNGSLIDFVSARPTPAFGANTRSFQCDKAAMSISTLLVHR